MMIVMMTKNIVIVVVVFRIMTTILMMKIMKNNNINILYVTSFFKSTTRRWILLLIQTALRPHHLTSGNGTNSMSMPFGVSGTAITPTSASLQLGVGVGPTGTTIAQASQTFVLCTQKVQACHTTFNASLAAAGQGDIQAICQ